MLVTEEKPLAEVLERTAGQDKVFIVGCQGCPMGWETGGPDKVAALAGTLEGEGKTVVGTVMIDFLCNKALVALKLKRKLEQLKQADAILVSSCGVGVQSTSAMVDLPCHPVLNTLSSSGQQGLWPGEERCGQCGECVLSLTAGVCPITTCAKSMLNGPCGGSHLTKCEVEPDRPCGWYRIYDRLKEQGRLDQLKKLPHIRNFRKMDIPMKQRASIRRGLER
ncbi:methylenetetrahydrofolate reductase C-terminal domain-containing protein [Planctomycetota bacterium]